MSVESLKAVLNKSALIQLCRESKDGTLNLAVTFNGLGKYQADEAKRMVIPYLLEAGISITNTMIGSEQMLLYGRVRDFVEVANNSVFGFFLAHFTPDHNGPKPS
ncbi:MAG: hypothetical protein CMH30_01580 [Micavibrio sp.]|nr:hypothetical protein [Micavibrio sp.]|tara:strand:- start:1683 stop:1997 length:315 start_codon:yes stop_codon:yes gene_type:complete